MAHRRAALIINFDEDDVPDSTQPGRSSEAAPAVGAASGAVRRAAAAQPQSRVADAANILASRLPSPQTAALAAAANTAASQTASEQQAEIERLKIQVYLVTLNRCQKAPL